MNPSYPSCPKCNTQIFELTAIEPRGSTTMVNLIHCAGCGAAVGAVDYFDSGVLLKQQDQKINDLGDHLRTIEHLVASRR